MNEINEVTIGDRLKYLRKQKRLTQKQMADKCGCTENFIYRLEHNKRKIQETTLSLLKLNFNANKEWILTGEGEMYGDPLDGVEGELHLKNLVRQILDLPQEQQDHVFKIIDTFLNK